jgi:hypothetical protein
VTVAAIDSSGADLKARARRPNLLLRQARLGTRSPYDSGRPMSRQEVAEAVNAYVYATTGRVSAMDAHYVSRLERGVRRYPTEDYRAALRAVLGAASDAELGFVPTRPARSRMNGAGSINEAAAPFAQAQLQGLVTRLVVTPGMAAVVVPTERPVLVTLVERQR